MYFKWMVSYLAVYFQRSYFGKHFSSIVEKKEGLELCIFGIMEVLTGFKFFQQVT